MGYLDQDLNPKGLTTGAEIAEGSIELRHLSAPLFLELQNIRLHNHEGSVSKRLGPNAVPENLAGYSTYERVEHYKATWTGSASSSGGLAVTFNKEFRNAPTVIAIGTGRASADLRVTTNTVTTTGCTVYWALSSGTATSIDLHIMVIGK